MSVSRLRWAVNCTAWAPTKQEWLGALSLIQQEEVERVGKFVFCRDAKLALVGRLLLRAGIVEVLGVSNDDVCLKRSDKGKPLLEGAHRDDISFNVSHQGDFAVLATEDGRPVGVDVMQFTRPRGESVMGFFHTMRRQFTEREWTQIKAASTERDQLNNFYRFWCLKESLIKAEGSGLSFGLQNLEFVVEAQTQWSPRPEETISSSCVFIKGEKSEEWRFEETLLNFEHCVAVAVLDKLQHKSPVPVKTTPSVVFSQLSIQQLLNKLGTDNSEVDYGHLEREWELYKSKQR